jgi:DNA-binding NtrC family response regulator
MNVRANATILVVDDDTLVRNLMRVFLDQAGFPVLAADDGAKGLTCFETHRNEVALLLTDIDMPRMNGLELAQRVREECPRMPVVLVSGSFSQFGGAPPTDYHLLEKPFGLRELVGVVEKALAIPLMAHGGR